MHCRSGMLDFNVQISALLHGGATTPSRNCCCWTIQHFPLFSFFCCFFFTCNIFEVPYHQRKIRDHVIMSIWRIMMNIWRWRLGWMARRMSPPTSAAKIIVIQVFITVTIITIIIITVTVTSSASSSTLFFFRKYGWTHTGIPSGGNCTGSKSLKHCFQWLETFETFSLARNLWNIWDRSANCPRVDDLDPTLSDLVFAFLLCWVQSDATSNLFIFYTRSSWKHPNMVFCATKRCLHEVLYIVSVFVERYSIYKLKSLFSHRHDMFFHGWIHFIYTLIYKLKHLLLWRSHRYVFHGSFPWLDSPASLSLYIYDTVLTVLVH